MNKEEYEAIKSDLEFLEDWEDRYRYIIETGQSLDKLDESQKNETNRIQGCVSQVWLTYSVEEKDGENYLQFNGESDAHIVQGLVAIALKLFSGTSAGSIVEAKPKHVFETLGLQQHLSSQRSNGLKSLLQRIEDIALHYS